MEDGTDFRRIGMRLYDRTQQRTALCGHAHERVFVEVNQPLGDTTR